MEGDEERVAVARRLLRRHWGHPEFRPGQRSVVRAILAGRDVLAVLPTGGGKSVCFQIPALLSPGPTLVVSPLLSLMEDQVAGARRRGLSAACLASGTPAPERRRLERSLTGAGTGAPKLLYVSPERLASRAFVRAMAGVPVSRIAVDEAHCVSEWGHDFRPAYRRIPDFYAAVGRPPVAAFTATATPETRRDLVAGLRLWDPVVIRAGIDRPNLFWEAERADGLAAAVRRVVEELRRRSGAAIVYLPTRRRAVGTAEACRRGGIVAEPYHAGLRADLRAAVQRRFLEARTRVVCATSAFGMGIDHPAVRSVLHVGIPDSLEAYVQGAGRAGRDGGPALCRLISHPGDAELQREMIRRSWPAGRWLIRAWRTLEPDRPVTLEELAERMGNGAGREATAGALRALVARGVVRSAPGEEGELLYRRGPAPLRRRLDPGALRRGRRRAVARLRAVRRYVSTKGCRRRVLWSWFGEEACGCRGCDRCRAGRVSGAPTRR